MRIQVEVPDETYERFKAVVAKDGTTMSEVLRESIQRLLAHDEVVERPRPKRIRGRRIVE